MPRKTKEQRLELTKQFGMELGLPERHAEVLAKVSFRRNLDGRVRYLMQHYDDDYKKIMERYNQMWEDPAEFYLQNKYLRIKGAKRFPRYGSMSLAYSMASPYQLIMFLLEDAHRVRIESELILETTGRRPRDGEEYGFWLFEEQRFNRLETAFRQDLRGNGISMDLVDTLLNAVEWQKASIPARYDDFVTIKQNIMDAFYLFFSSSEGERFVEEWKRGDSREGLIDTFSYRFFNDPRVNPKLVAMELGDVGTKKYEESCVSYGENFVFFPNGARVKRSEIDARKTRTF